MRCFGHPLTGGLSTLFYPRRVFICGGLPFETQGKQVQPAPESVSVTCRTKAEVLSHEESDGGIAATDPADDDAGSFLYPSEGLQRHGATDRRTPRFVVHRIHGRGSGTDAAPVQDAEPHDVPGIRFRHGR